MIRLFGGLEQVDEEMSELPKRMVMWCLRVFAVGALVGFIGWLAAGR